MNLNLLKHSIKKLISIKFNSIISIVTIYPRLMILRIFCLGTSIPWKLTQIFYINLYLFQILPKNPYQSLTTDKKQKIKMKTNQIKNKNVKKSFIKSKLPNRLIPSKKNVNALKPSKNFFQRYLEFNNLFRLNIDIQIKYFYLCIYY